MKKLFLPFAFCLLPFALAPAARANWQYPGDYLGTGVYSDDGGRMTISLRGGASIASGKIQNDVSSLSAEYFEGPGGIIVSAAWYDACVLDGGCADGFYYAGLGDIGTLPAQKKFSNFGWAGGASIGWVMPNSPRWRIEAGWDHISESEYNAAPLFDGNLALIGGSVGSVSAQSGGVQSTVATDIISVMFFYDFFDGLQKPQREFIPYIGFGLGYADSKTTMLLSDLYGDLSWSVDLENYAERDDYGVLQFYKSSKSSANVSGLLSFGFSYGLAESTFLDLGIRMAYVPKIKWALQNPDTGKERDWFSAKGTIYTNIMLGIRFEF
ncbi:MAG: hypothetical protein LBJ18_00710 [Rickettsiales bacterium]|nr:hypothetical protein [Rickettsiales bacterium]